MIRVLYVVVAVAVLAPSVIASAVLLYSQHRVREEVRASFQSTTVSASRRIFAQPVFLQLGAFRLPIAARPWAAVLIVAGSVLWVIGITFLLLRV